MLVKLKQKRNCGIKNYSPDAKCQKLRKFVLSILRPCNPSFNDIFILALF